MLATTETGGGDNPPLLIAHGLFGSARNWSALARKFGTDRRVISVDMRNHGLSPWYDSHKYTDLAADLAEVIGTETWDVLGHSMGGKAAMTLALTNPDRVGRLIVADIAPVTYGHSHLGFIHAMQALDLSDLTTRSAADEALAPGVEDAATRAFLLHSLDLKEKKWRLNLGVLAAEMDELIGFPDLPGRFDRPAYFLSGGASDYVRSEHRGPIRQLFPKARFAKIPDAGHWLHAEKPREFEASVRAILG